VDKRQARAYEVFVLESGGALFRMAILLTSNRAEAEDLYQETLQRLAARWSRVGNPRAFCRRVMNNLIIDERRSTARRPRRETLEDEHGASDLASSDAQQAVELRGALLQALDSLSPQQRAVVVLRYFDDRSEAEVADLLDVSPGTVKAAASRAMARLRSDSDLIDLFCPNP
jgi:RNA polymerase sigma-70 factor (sigma-E family)